MKENQYEIFWFDISDSEGTRRAFYGLNPKDKDDTPILSNKKHYYTGVCIKIYTKDNILLREYQIPESDFEIFMLLMEKVKQDQYDNLLRTC